MLRFRFPRQPHFSSPAPHKSAYLGPVVILTACYARRKIRPPLIPKPAKKRPGSTAVPLHTKNFLQFSTIEIAVEMHRKP